MLAKRLGTILPPLAAAESLDTTRIYSAVGQLKPGKSLLATRPFRSPHHTISDAGMVGGGYIPQPGEISMAHHGILFLDGPPVNGRRAVAATIQGTDGDDDDVGEEVLAVADVPGVGQGLEIRADGFDVGPLGRHAAPLRSGAAAARDRR